MPQNSQVMPLETITTDKRIIRRKNIPQMIKDIDNKGKNQFMLRKSMFKKAA